MLSKTRACVGAAVFAILVAGCPSDPEIDPGTDGGTTPTEEGGALPDSSTPTDSAVDTGPPPPPCSRLTTPCAEGGACEGALDCASKVCRDGKCVAAAPADGTKNGDETDVDCGGSKAPACADGKGCLVAADCTSSVCTGGKCQVPTDTDGVKNGDETGKDCGGSSSKKCPTGEGCKTTADCDAVLCDATTKKCKAAAHDDGIKNLDETGIDCGGPTAGVARCPTGQGCNDNTDCNNILCNGGAGAGTCDPPSSTDGLKNGSETDVDCGGGAPTNAPKCIHGKSCTVANDCSSGGCNYLNKCAWARSCVKQHGGVSCGKGEVGQAGAAHEDCCTSIPLPSNPNVAIDKYEITAGRMREFITQTANNVAGWVNANRMVTGQIADEDIQYLPTSNTAPVRSITRCDSAGNNCTTVNQGFGVREHLGNNVFMPDRPCNNCGQGCWFNTGAGQNGHPTYWWPNATQANDFGAGNRVATQEQLDAKSLNCTPQLLFAAFCAWDGGRLPTQPELGGANGAWGPTGMPWGGPSNSYQDTVAGNEAGRTNYSFAGGFLVPMLTAGGGYNANAANVNTTNWNPFSQSPAVFQARYVYPVPVNTATNDQAYAVASPGRMRNDFRSVGPGADDGYYDIAANLMEVTATFTGNDNANHNGWKTYSWVGGSFEGHGAENRGGYNLSLLTKYGKQGARCARDL